MSALKPPPGQACECTVDHAEEELGPHRGKLERVYSQDENRLCYWWVCAYCRKNGVCCELDWECDEDVRRGPDGRFRAATRCEKLTVG